MLLLCAGAFASPPLSGVWVLAEDPADLNHRIETQIQDLTADKFFGVRGVMRRVLGRATSPCREYAVLRTSTEATIRCDAQAPATAPMTGDPVPFRGDDGRRLKLAVQRPTDDEIVQTFKSGQSVRTNRFVWSAGDQQLQVEVTIESNWLPHPFVYALPYTRAMMTATSH